MDNSYIEKFKKDLEDIEQLISTPDTIKDFVIKSLKKMRVSELKYSERTIVKNLILSLENISQHSISKSYKIIYNQVCILAVSALAAAIEKYFIDAIKESSKQIILPKEIKISLAEAQEKYKFEIKNNLGKIILEKDNSINFQDLQSTIRTFKNYFSRNIKLKSKVKDFVIFYQQCRHVLVHKNGIIDDEFLSRTSKLTIKKLKQYEKGDKVELNKEDWRQIKTSFISFIQSLTN